METKKCPRCLQDKPITEFHKCKTKARGLYTICKDCSSIESAKQHQAYKEKNQNREIDLTAIKKCSSCGEEKTLENFYKESSTRDGVSSLCKVCKEEQRRKRALLKLSSPTIKNPEELKRCSKCGTLKSQTEYTICNSTGDGLNYRCKECQNNYAKKNRERINKRIMERYRTEPAFKITHLIRGRFRKIIARYKCGSKIKTENTKYYFGCSVEELILWIESQFKPGMTWDNHGLWHVDHIMPLSSFDFTKPGQLEKAWNWKNLQPLWAEENLKKGDRVFSS